MCFKLFLPVYLWVWFRFLTTICLFWKWNYGWFRMGISQLNFFCYCFWVDCNFSSLFNIFYLFTLYFAYIHDNCFLMPFYWFYFYTFWCLLSEVYSGNFGQKKNRPDKITTIKEMKESCLLRKLWYWLTISKMGCMLGEAF